MIDLGFPLLQMIWAVTAGVLLVSSVMIIRAALTVGTTRAATSAIMWIWLMLVALTLVAQSAGFAPLALPQLGPVFFLELTAILVPVSLAIIAVLTVARSRGHRQFTPVQSDRGVVKPVSIGYSVVVTSLAAISFLAECISFFMPWIRFGTITFTLGDLYAGFLGQDTIQEHLLRQLLHQVSPASVLADSFVAVALVMALYPACLLFMLISLYPRRAWPISTASTLTIAAAIMTLYSEQSLASHLYGPVPLSGTAIRLEPGPSTALLVGGLLSLAYSVLILRHQATATHETRPVTPITSLVGRARSKKESTPPLTSCPSCGMKVDSHVWYCPKCGARLTVKV